MWSTCTLLQGEVTDFRFFALFRVLLGVFLSMVHSPGLGILRDSFPPSYRSTVNSVYAFASFLGGGIASLTILLIEKYGWRSDYEIVGLTGIVLGILCVTLVSDPERGYFEKK